jgi:hypothetical protein
MSKCSVNPNMSRPSYLSEESRLLVGLSSVVRKKNRCPAERRFQQDSRDGMVKGLLCGAKNQFKGFGLACSKKGAKIGHACFRNGL